MILQTNRFVLLTLREVVFQLQDATLILKDLPNLN